MNTNVRPITVRKCGAPVPPKRRKDFARKCVLAGAATPDRDRAAARHDTEKSHRSNAWPQRFRNSKFSNLSGAAAWALSSRPASRISTVSSRSSCCPTSWRAIPHFAERFNREGRVLARAEPSEHRQRFRFRATAERFYLPDDGICRWREPAPGHARRTVLAGRGAGHRAEDLRGAAIRARARASSIATSSRRTSCSTRKGRVKIADFGIAKLVGERQAGRIAHGDRRGARHAALHGAGAIGETVRRGSPRGHLFARRGVLRNAHGRTAHRPFRAALAKATLDERVDEIVFRALEKDRELRHQSAGEMKTEVEGITSSGKPTAVAPPAQTPAPVAGAQKQPDPPPTLPGQTNAGVLGGTPTAIQSTARRWSQTAIWVRSWSR